ncbi:MAG: phosphoribosylanthranilate isomerase [Treponema sp.]|nr:phosphoribosylanthranilate isomerase [Treponema sp.]
MKIKICGLVRKKDISFVNEALPDYCGFVFADSRRQVTLSEAKRLRSRLAENVIPVGVFVNTPPAIIRVLYCDNVISIAQLHGNENEEYIIRLKNESTNAGRLPPIKIIKVINADDLEKGKHLLSSADFFLIDSGAGTGKTFGWKILNSYTFGKPWFLAGGVNIDNIEQAAALNPFAIDVSSGAETDGFKDREKILRLTKIIHGEEISDE